VAAGRLVHPRGKRDTVRLADVTEARIVVSLRKGQTLDVRAGDGAQLEVTRFESGAVHLRNATTRKVYRAWTPKEAEDAA
jgi:hypothetical protein